MTHTRFPDRIGSELRTPSSPVLRSLFHTSHDSLLLMNWHMFCFITIMTNTTITTITIFIDSLYNPASSLPDKKRKRGLMVMTPHKWYKISVYSRVTSLVSPLAVSGQNKYYLSPLCEGLRRGISRVDL